MYWYDGVKQSDGSYKAVVNVQNHQYSRGIYRAHVYVTMGNDITVSKNAGTCEVTMPKANVEIEDISGNEKTYQIVGKNLGVYGNIKQVRYAVWSRVGKGADLKWYDASKDSQGVWKANIAISNHRQAGEYLVDTYVILMNGASICVGTSNFTVSEPTMDIEMGNYDVSSGSFEIIVRNINSPSGVKQVRFPVWNEADSNTMYWYDGVKQSDGSYKAVVNVQNHQYSKGTYRAHVYVTMGNDITISNDGGTQEIVEVIIKDLYSIMGTSTVSIEQMIRLFNMNNPCYPVDDLKKGGANTIQDFCEIACEEAEAEGVKVEVLFAQMMLETGYLKFGGDVKISQFNFGGLGATGGGEPGNSFENVRIGIRAQVQHLKCYASSSALNQERVDKRWNDSLRMKAPYVQWLGIPDNPYGVGWAGTKGYGDRIINIINQMKNI